MNEPTTEDLVALEQELDELWPLLQQIVAKHTKPLDDEIVDELLRAIQEAILKTRQNDGILPWWWLETPDEVQLANLGCGAHGERLAEFFGKAPTRLRQLLQRLRQLEAERDLMSNHLAQIQTWSEDYDAENPSPWHCVASAIAATVENLRSQLAEAQRNREQERARLAACYVAAADPTAEPLASGAYSWSPSYEEVVKLRTQLAKAERDRERFHQQIEAAVSYAGILAIEVKDLIGLAIAHGFKGWPEHQVIGDELRAILQLEQGEIEAAGREAIDEARAREADNGS